MKNLDKLTEALIQVVESIKSAAETQLPEIARQIVEYEAYSALVGCIVAGLIAFVAFISVAYLFRWARKEHDEFVASAAIFAFLLSIVPVGVSVGFFLDYKKCQMAPKAVAIEKIARMIR